MSPPHQIKEYYYVRNTIDVFLLNIDHHRGYLTVVVAKTLLITRSAKHRAKIGFAFLSKTR